MEERRAVDQRLFSIRNHAQLIEKNVHNRELVIELNAHIQDDIGFLIQLLTTKEDY